MDRVTKVRRATTAANFVGLRCQLRQPGWRQIKSGNRAVWNGAHESVSLLSPMDPLISTPDLGIDTGLVTNDRSFAQLLGANLAISDGEIGTFSTPVPSPEDEYPREAAGQGQSRAGAARGAGGGGLRGPATVRRPCLEHPLLL